MINSPVRWIGGKSRLRKQIISIIPNNHTCYVELFCGGAWVLFGKNPSLVEVINDIDTELINFFQIVKNNPVELINSFRFELVSRFEFNRLANIDISQLTQVERAHRFYYLIMAGWGGELDYPRFQTSIIDAGHGNRLIGALKHLEQKIMPVCKRLQTVIIENLDWQECFKRYDNQNTFMYIDPPYPKNGCNYLHNMRNWNDHIKLAEYLHNSKCQWILSSYDNEQIRDLYKYFEIVPVSSLSGMSVKRDNKTKVVNQEVLIIKKS